MKIRKSTLLIFTLMTLTIPVLFFLFQAIAFIPLAGIISFGLTTDSPGLVIFSFIHTAVFAPLLWIIANSICKRIDRVDDAKKRRNAYLAVSCAFIALAAIGPYASGGHGNDQTLSWLGALNLK